MRICTEAGSLVLFSTVKSWLALSPDGSNFALHGGNGKHQNKNEKQKGAHGRLLFGRNSESERFFVSVGHGAGQRFIRRIGNIDVLRHAKNGNGAVRHETAGRNRNAIVADRER